MRSSHHGDADDYPCFFSPEVGRFSKLVELPSKILGRDHRIRGYLFFPEDAFMGQDWKVEETGDVLRAMNAVEDFLILGLYSGDRMTEYTKPGYELYARSLVEEVVPELERRGIRTELSRQQARPGRSAIRARAGPGFDLAPVRRRPPDRLGGVAVLVGWQAEMTKGPYLASPAAFSRAARAARRACHRCRRWCAARMWNAAHTL
jgi:hypothetical protein